MKWGVCDVPPQYRKQFKTVNNTLHLTPDVFWEDLYLFLRDDAEEIFQGLWDCAEDGKSLAVQCNWPKSVGRELGSAVRRFVMDLCGMEGPSDKSDPPARRRAGWILNHLDQGVGSFPDCSEEDIVLLGAALKDFNPSYRLHVHQPWFMPAPLQDY